MSVDVQPSQPPGKLLSRYLSMRNSALDPNASTSSSPPSQAGPATPNASSIARSMSRYHRTRPVNAPTQVKSPPLLSTYEHVNDVPSPRPRRRQNTSPPILEDPFKDSVKSRYVEPSISRRQCNNGDTPRSRTRRHSGSADRRPRQERPQSEARDSALMRQTSGDTEGSPRSGEQRRKADLQRSPSDQSELARQEDRERIAQEQAERWKMIKRKELERLEKELAAAKPPAPAPKVNQPSGRFGFITRRWGDKAPGQVAATNAEGTRFWRKKEAAPMEVAPISGPGADAPVSAVNAGERKILIKYNKSTITLPVTPTTMANDLLHSAAIALGQNTGQEAFVLLEAFAQLGLERPIRKYEPIRQILNSWAYDTQNALLLVSSVTGSSDDDLEARFVPKKEPSDTSAYLYFSQKPGKWDKRWITLRSDGQLMASKRDGVRETTNICHLSDFDIYSPTPRQLSKKIKPPKKVCFAIKSQQKASMFLSTTTFVHFFATNDRRLAASWYKAVQAWRSWYLVNVMGEGQKKPKDVGQGAARVGSAGSQNMAFPLSPKPRHAHNPSAESKPYHNASPKPFMNIERYEHVTEPTSPPINQQTRELHARNISSRQRSAPPVSYPKGLVSEISDAASPSRDYSPPKNQLTLDTDPRTFSPNGLLGNGYTERQRAQQTRDSDPSPPTTGIQPEPHLPLPASTSGLTRNTSVRSTKPTTTGLQRNSSTRQKPKPLVDLSPEYREPPQHVKKGRGIIPSQLPPGGLVDIATSPEIAIEVPSATAWRRPVTSNGNGNGNGSGGRPGTSSGPRPPATSFGENVNGGRPGTSNGRPMTSVGSPEAGIKRIGTVKSSARPQTAYQAGESDDEDEALINLLNRSGTTKGVVGRGGKAAAAVRA
ncbi:MAG: hypothetical protein M1836_003549 [Candelina mexicana]|nr:MAG: hypothetical protein M1836_003549 [Candelina mexicana]